ASGSKKKLRTLCEQYKEEVAANLDLMSKAPDGMPKDQASLEKRQSPGNSLGARLSEGKPRCAGDCRHLETRLKRGNAMESDPIRRRFLRGGPLAAAWLLAVGNVQGADAQNATARPASSSGQVKLLRVPNSGIQPQTVVDGKGVVHMIYFAGEPR